MSDPIQRAIASSADQWLQSHPAVFKLVQILVWGSNHPVWSFAIFIVVVAIALNLIKLIGQLIEVASRSLLLAPFKLIFVTLKVSFQYLWKALGLVFKKDVTTNNAETLALPDTTSEIVEIEKDKQQRLIEIAKRLETLRQEQDELLQEVASILPSEKSDETLTC
ncbi:MAG TPA: hypothetical protein V6D15_07620 [Oculatellaceae cyanobacterium]|jgi:low affinity Fe/Cu permease